VVIPLSVAASTDLGPYAAAMGFGFLIGVWGHLIRSRALILTGILIVGLVSAYFAFIVGKVS
jgi:hypothetical protein